MTFEIIVTNGHWTVNGKRINELTMFEKSTLNNFFQELKQNGNTSLNSTNSRVRPRNNFNNQNQ